MQTATIKPNLKLSTK